MLTSCFVFVLSWCQHFCLYLKCTQRCKRQVWRVDRSPTYAPPQARSVPTPTHTHAHAHTHTHTHTRTHPIHSWPSPCLRPQLTDSRRCALRTGAPSCSSCAPLWCLARGRGGWCAPSSTCCAICAPWPATGTPPPASSTPPWWGSGGLPPSGPRLGG